MTLTRPSDRRPSDDDVLAFLREHHGIEPTRLEVLSGGFWSAAFGYRIGDDELVLRVNDGPDGFRSDAAAVAYASPSLPVPDVLSIGEAFGRWYAISRRHHGRFLESVPAAEAHALGPTVIELLTALRGVPDRGEVTLPWHRFLLDGLTDHADRPTAGWRRGLADHAAAERAFVAAEARVQALLEACPDRRELVHGDLLHFNVLVSPPADAVTAVFSWKCATRGDAAYDLAWCTFWGRWHPGIGALDLWSRVAPTLSRADAVDLAVRHHVYELQIGASHLGWYVATGDQNSLDWTTRQLDELLEHGPLPPP